MSNFCRGKPLVRFNTLKVIIPSLIEWVIATPVEMLSADPLYALGFLTDGDNHEIDFVMSFNGQGLINKLVEICVANKKELNGPVTRILGNLVTSSDENTDMVIHTDGLKWICRGLIDENVMNRKEAAWTISNISAGTIQQVKML